ncbi:RagB/SusD family nutrient uptake outer membrane protein, partial [Ornithobacterium rhinotracheale]|uniref:RagB/SusD family nutrient uptake outer membrane protein n=1 Tax=Ornithobacterium rhinotracheale TaxID=28251 RepID=UPI001FF49DE5
LVTEGFRMNDLKRWRALDQVNGYQVKGIRLWSWLEGDILSAGEKKNYSTVRFYPESNSPNMSNPSFGEYFLPYKVNPNNRFYNGYTWVKAHYYEPIAFEELQLASPDGNPDHSTIYQNPGWPTQAGAVAKVN